MIRRSFMGSIAALFAGRRAIAEPAFASGGLIRGSTFTLIGEAPSETVMPLNRKIVGRIGVSSVGRNEVSAGFARLGGMSARYEEGGHCLPISEFRSFMGTQYPELRMRGIEPS